MSQDQYQAQINHSKRHNARYLVPYKEIQKTKKECYPSNVIVEPGLVQVPIWSILQHQLPRIIEAEDIMDWILRIYNEEPDDTDFQFHYKYGADACTSNSQYQTQDRVDQNAIFTSYMVPLFIKAVSKSDPNKYTILYAERMCVSETRVIPLRMCMEKETKRNSYQNSRHVCMCMKL